MPKKRIVTEAPVFPASRPDVEWPKNTLKKRLQQRFGQLAIGSVVVGTAFGLMAAAGDDTPTRADGEVTTQTVVDEKLVPVEGNERIALLVNEQPSRAVWQDFAPDFSAGILSELQSQDIDASMQEATHYLQRNPEAQLTLRISGSASDESGSDSVDGDANLGKPSLHNKQLAEDRRDTAYERAITYMHGFGERLKIEKGGAEEMILSARDQAVIAKAAGDRGMTREAFMKQYNNDGPSLQLSRDEKMALFGMIDAYRGFDVTPLANPTGIDPMGSDVVLRLVETERQEVVETAVDNDGSRGAALLPLFAAPALALLVRRRKRNGATDTTPVIPQESPVVYEGRLEDKIGWIMKRSQENHEEEKQARINGGRFGKLSYAKRWSVEAYHEMLTSPYAARRRKLGIAAVVAASLPVVATLGFPSFYDAEDAHATTVTRTATATIETTPAYTKRKMYRFPVIETLSKRLGRQFVLHEETVPAVVRTTPHNVYTFDAAGNLLPRGQSL